MVRLALFLYNLAFPFLFILYLPFFLTKLIRRGNFKEGFWERFGSYSQDKRERFAAHDDWIWIHAVSVGETVAALSFIQRWNEKEPGLHFVLSTTTSTGQAIARKKAPDNVITVYFPMDQYFIVRRALARVRPRMIVIFEVEVWPTLIAMAHRRGIKLALVNCRMSDNSAAGYAKHGWLFGDIFGRFDVIATQTPEDAARIERVTSSTDRLHVCNTMKFDQVADCEGADVQQILARAFADAEIIFNAASTHPGEEQVMADCYLALREKHPGLRMILVPRHVERAADIVALLTDSGLTVNQLTDLRQSNGSAEARDVLLVNTTGELMNFLAASDIVFVGKSLGGNEGGHNIIEPAIFGKPILFGQHMENFRVVAQTFREANAAIEVADEAAFQEQLERLLNEPGERERLTVASRETVDKNRGAVAKTIALLEAL